MKHSVLAKLEASEGCCVCGQPPKDVVTFVLNSDRYSWPVCSAPCAYKLGLKSKAIVLRLSEMPHVKLRIRVNPASPPKRRRAQSET